MHGSAILVVDDEPSVLMMLRAVLESAGHDVTTSSSAAAARQKLQTTTYDLVLTDMRMETPTAGFDVVRAARSRPEQPAVVILTAFPMLEREWREAGADAVLMKGIPVKELTAAIDHCLAARELRR